MKWNSADIAVWLWRNGLQGSLGVFIVISRVESIAILLLGDLKQKCDKEWIVE